MTKTDDLAELYADVSDSDFQFMQLTGGPLGYVRTETHLPEVTISWEAAEQRLRTRMQLTGDDITVSFLIGGQASAI